MTDLAQLLDAERQRLARKVPTPEQRKRRRLAGHWTRNLSQVWDFAHLLTDEELTWLAQIATAARRPTNLDDAVRLEALVTDLWRRDREDEQRLEAERRRPAARMRRLGLESPSSYGFTVSYRLGIWPIGADEVLP